MEAPHHACAALAVRRECEGNLALPGEPEAEADSEGSSAGGRIARSAIVSWPGASGGAARAPARSGAHTWKAGTLMANGSCCFKYVQH
jgi:hypothetical protein